MVQPDAMGKFHGAEINHNAISWRDYSSLAAFLVLLVDHASLMSTEVKYIWRSENRPSKFLYIICRYFPVCIHIVNYTFVQLWLVNSPISTIRCQAWFWFLAIACSASVIFLDSILLLRVYALYLKNNMVWFLAAPLLGTHIIAQIVLTDNTVYNPSFSPYCDLYKTPPIVVGLGAVTVISHLGLWLAIFNKRKVSQAAVLSLVVKESHMTFLLVMCPVLVFTPLCFLSTANPFLIFLWPITFLSITSCRIVLNMLQLKTESPTNSHAVSTTDFLFSTILDSTRTQNTHESSPVQLAPIGIQ